MHHDDRFGRTLCHLKEDGVLSQDKVNHVVRGIFGDDLHLARIASLENGVNGLLGASRLSIHAIGAAYAQLAGIQTKSGIKQVDRMLSNPGLPLDVMQSAWVRFTIGDTNEIVVAIDWTEFDDDSHSTLAIYLATTHGRAMPLVWRTVDKKQLKGNRTRYELQLIEALHSVLDPAIDVILLGDRGFGYVELYEYLQTLGWDYVLRFRQGITVWDAAGTKRTAKQWTPSNGRARCLLKARITDARHELEAVVCVKKLRMKEAWCLATSLVDIPASEVVALYAKRFSIEETFRDTKDINFGLGMRCTHIRDGARRDRLLMLVAIAHTLLCLLGEAGEACGLDRTLKANTSKKRTLSLFRQGLQWVRSLPNMPDHRARTLLLSYEKVLTRHPFIGMILAYSRRPAEVYPAK